MIHFVWFFLVIHVASSVYFVFSYCIHFWMFRFWSSSCMLALITVEILNNFPNGWRATFKLNLIRCFSYFAFDQFPWASHALESFSFRNGENTLYVHDSCSCSVFQFITTRNYWWENILPLLLLNDVFYSVLLEISVTFVSMLLPR